MEFFPWTICKSLYNNDPFSVRRDKLIGFKTSSKSTWPFTVRYLHRFLRCAIAIEETHAPLGKLCAALPAARWRTRQDAGPVGDPRVCLSCWNQAQARATYVPTKHSDVDRSSFFARQGFYRISRKMLYSRYLLSQENFAMHMVYIRNRQIVYNFQPLNLYLDQKVRPHYFKNLFYMYLFWLLSSICIKGQTS